MTAPAFLIEDEEAALVVPARFLGQIHPQIQQLRAIASFLLPVMGEGTFVSLLM